MASGDFLDSYSDISQWPGALPLTLEIPGSIPGVDSATFLSVLFLLLLVVVVGAASIMMLVVIGGELMMRSGDQELTMRSVVRPVMRSVMRSGER